MLLCNLVDRACCKWAPDGYCDPYCAYVDQDCRPTLDEGEVMIGTCTYTENSLDTCDDDGMLVRSLDALWQWAPGNEITQYDPLGRAQNCVPIESTFACPASIQLPFFGVYQLVIVIAVIGLIYLIWALRKKESPKKTGKRTRKKKGK